MLAGYLSCPRGRTQALAAALQWGAAAVQHEGTLFSPSASTTPVKVTDAIDLTRRLHDHDPTISAAGAAAERLRSRA
jgi:1-phosphofructokinase